jgi:hypothetical protein
MENEKETIPTPVEEPVLSEEEKKAIAQKTKKGILIASIFGGVLVVLFVTILSIGVPALIASNAKSGSWYKSRSGVYDSNDRWISGGASFTYEKSDDAASYKVTSINVLDAGAKTLVLPSLYKGEGDTSSLNVLGTGDAPLLADSQQKVKNVYLEGFYTYLGTSSFSDSTIESVSFGTTSSDKYNLEIGIRAFENATSLSKASFPSILKFIDEGAFHNASALTTLDLSKTVLSSLGKSTDTLGVFEGCTSLSTLKLPISLTSIGKNLFKSTPALTTVSYAGKMSDWNNISFATSWHDASLTSIRCSDGTIVL